MSNRCEGTRTMSTGLRISRIIAWAVLLACVISLCWLWTQQRHAKQLSQSLKDQYHSSMNAEATAVAEKQSIGEALAKRLSEAFVAEAAEMPAVVDTPLEIQPTFTELYEQNNDLIGWLMVCDHIEEPVLYRDNSYYMDRDYNGDYSQAGSIFLDEKDSVQMTDDTLLLYGHNMRSGMMFGDLDNFRDKSYLAQYPIIKLHSIYEETPREYVIFTMFDASMNSGDSSYIKIRQFNFETAEEKQAYIDELTKRSIFEMPVEADAGDQLVMLVTCSYSHDNGRFLVVARELRDGETAESVTELFQ